MHLANSTTARLKRIFGLLILVLTYSFSSAQENSPYSRYGIGDVVPNQNIFNRGMGGISIGYVDTLNNSTINFSNPAGLGYIRNTIFDIGGEIDIRTLKSTTSTEKYTATNTLISYFQLAFPLMQRKLKRTDANKNLIWAMSFGLRPVSRINYKIQEDKRLTGIDSLHTLYEGSGGLSQINIGTSLRVKNFSVGINTGYSFGNKDYSTKLEFINDTVIYYKSNTQSETRFSGFFLNVGAQYLLKLNKGVLNIGAYANLQQNLKAKQDNIEETFSYDGAGGTYTIDTVAYSTGVNGRVKIPATYGVGFTYIPNRNWLFGADFETTNWDTYRFYGQTDAVQNNWTIRLGGQYYPAKENTAASKYWSFVKYRIGFYYSPDYVKLTKTRPTYAATAGASFPLTSAQHIRQFGEYVLLHTGIEIGARGNKQSLGVRENITRINIGISMNAKWFQKRNYY